MIHYTINIPFNTVSEISTAHVTQQTMEWLDHLGCPLIADTYPTGAWVRVAKIDDDDNQPPDDSISKVIDYMIKFNVKWVRLDADAQILAELPTYKW